MEEEELYEQLIDTLDRALMSDDPRIKKALKKFLFVVSMTETSDDCCDGPFRKTAKAAASQEALHRRINLLEEIISTLGTFDKYQRQPGPQWVKTGPSTTPEVGTYTIDSGTYMDLMEQEENLKKLKQRWGTDYKL